MIAPAPTPIPAAVGQSIPVTGIGIGVALVLVCVPDETSVGVGDGVGLADDVQEQSVDDVQSGLLQCPPEQIYPDAQLLSLPHVPLHVFSAPTVGVGVGVTVGVGDGVGVGVAASELQTVMSVVQAAPGAGQQY